MPDCYGIINSFLEMFISTTCNMMMMSWKYPQKAIPTIIQLKEYYEIVDEARPLSGFFPTHADFFTAMHF